MAGKPDNKVWTDNIDSFVEIADGVWNAVFQPEDQYPMIQVCATIGGTKKWYGNSDNSGNIFVGTTKVLAEGGDGYWVTLDTDYASHICSVTVDFNQNPPELTLKRAVVLFDDNQSITGSPDTPITLTGTWPTNPKSLVFKLSNMTRTNESDWLTFYNSSSWGDPLASGIHGKAKTVTSISCLTTKNIVLFNTNGIFVAAEGITSAKIKIIAEYE